MRKTLSALCFFLILGLVIPSSAAAYYTNMPASVVVGQSNFTNSSANAGGSTSASGFDFPIGIATDGTRLFVADNSNNRVLIYNQIPTTNGAVADVVIGQTNFTNNSQDQGGSANANTLDSPEDVETDGTRLFISDGGNNRVLIFNRIPTSNNASADIVIGQPNMTTTSSGTSSTKFSGPEEADYDPQTGKLAIVDGNNRVLIYNTVPQTNGAAADVVVGQTSFNTSTSGLTASTFNSVFSVEIANGKLITGETQNSRALIFDPIPTTNGASASVVIGQPNFTSNSVNQCDGCSTAPAYALDNADGIAYDGRRLFISDGNNSRIAVFNEIPTANNTAAALVLGQSGFGPIDANKGQASPDATTLANSFFVDTGGGKLFVTDSSNNRVLIYENIESTPDISLDLPEKISDQKIKIRGNVILGERNRYALQKVMTSINGEAFVNATSLGGGRDNGSGSTSYDFFHEFDPRVSGGSSENYTAAFKAIAINGESSQAFYSTPFTFASVSNGRIFTFLVNKDKIQTIKDNVANFEIWAKKKGEAEWKKYIGNINTDSINTDGKVVVNKITGIESSGTYEFKIRALSKGSNYSQDSNILESSLTKTSPFNPLSLSLFLGWYPLQINSISQSKMALISTLNPAGDFNSYFTNSFSPTFTGIAFSNSTVAMVVTDELTNKTRTYTTKSENSTFSVKPILFQNSIIDFSVYDDAGRYNALPPFKITVQSQN